MQPSSIILAAACFGLVINSLVVLGIAWRGGHILGRMEGAMDTMASGLERVVKELDELEKRFNHHVEGGHE